MVMKRSRFLVFWLGAVLDPQHLDGNTVGFDGQAACDRGADGKGAVDVWQRARPRQGAGRSTAGECGNGTPLTRRNTMGRRWRYRPEPHFGNPVLP